jgi:serine phosphatase RsbU (regulator of sigma subunit)
LIATVYESVNSLMNAAAFGIGIYEEDKQIISFSGFIENNEVIEYHEYSLTDTESLPIYCLLNREEILVNNLAKDIYNYLPHYSKDLTTSYGNIPESLIYLPLLLENKVTGVITVQAFQKDAYNSNDIAILKTLASYIAIALDNAKAYTQIAKTQEALAEQNKHIMDSIRYGETIQKAMLPHEKDLQANFHAYFIVYKPKDVVSGDFYWFSKELDMKFLAVVDCTGHGVPGAFMSMIGISLLHEAINQQNIYSPAAVLEYLHQEIRTALKQDETTNRDGMDVCLCKILDKSSNNQLTITYGGAKRPLFYTDKGELKELKGNRKNIGGRTKDKIEAVFEEETITIDAGEMLYLSTDGFADQANDKRDKFSILHFKNLLQQISDKECNEQKNIMVEALKNHQQQAEQRDDISVIGVRL